jgi:hypothetical protein
MGRVVEIDEALWVRLNDAAKQARRTPEGLVRSLTREYLEVGADRALDKALREAVKASGRKEKDAVRTIHEYRAAVRARTTSRVSDVSRSYRRSRSK